MIERFEVRVPARDGTRLAARITRPAGAGRFPALLAVSPYRYDNDDAPVSPLFLWRETGPIDWYASQGYAYVHADVRGTGQSEGEYGFLDRNEQHDLHDLVEWIAAQPWCSGKVGGIGQSYYCMAQWFMGIENPPHLACIAPFDGLNDPYGYMVYPGGIEGNFLLYWFNSSVRVPNLYPTNGRAPRFIERDIFLEAQQHPLYDEYWKERTAAERLEEIRVPVFAMGVWSKHEFHTPGVLLGYQKAKGPKRLVVTRTPNYFAAQREFGEVAFHRRYLLPFYDRFLKGLETDWEARSPVEYEVRNTEAVRRFDTWPPPGTRPMSLFLGAGPSGAVASLNDGVLQSAPSTSSAPTSYSYPQASWVLGIAALTPTGPDVTSAVLTFTSSSLEDDLEIAGEGKVILHASTTGTDADFIVKVWELSASSPSLVTKGWLRASHAHSHTKPVAVVPGEVFRLGIQLMPIAWRFSRGSRIRLDIACGDSIVTESLYMHLYRPDKIGTDSVYHDAAHPSQLVLPVLPC